jgi:hypothetical protein
MLVRIARAARGAFIGDIQLLLRDVVGAPAVPVLEDSKSKGSRALAVFGAFAVGIELEVGCDVLAGGAGQGCAVLAGRGTGSVLI